MNISLQGTKVTQDNKTLAFEKNNLVDDIIVTVDTDETWEYKLDVKYAGNQCRDDKYNVIQLERTGNTASVKLTADMLPFKGKYIMQLRGYTADGKVYHSETFDSWVKYSIDPSEVYEPLPSEFYQFERQIEKAVPKGGDKGQVLTKLSDEDFDTEWKTPTGGTGGVQSDWNQNDETQPDYVKNRPFYTGDPVETVLLAETTLNVQAQQNGILIFGVQNVDFAFEIGKTYKVSWDGTMYNCVAFNFIGSGYGAIGNQQIIGGADTGEPFIATVDYNTFMIYTSDTAASHTVAISGYEPEIVKIDEKYLPDNYVIYRGNLANWATSKHKQMLEDYRSGKLVFYSESEDDEDAIYPVLYLTYASTDETVQFSVLHDNGKLVQYYRFNNGVGHVYDYVEEEYVDKKAIGMNITSATVGQIAKISAIDANGVPTAWEPVDLPSGGGGSEEWELVFTETITEDTGSYSRNVDTNGEAFELDEAVLIVLTLPFAESTNSSGRAIGMSPTSYWGHDVVTEISNSIASGAQKVAHYDVAHVKVINGYQICLSMSGSQNDINAFGNMMSSISASARIGAQFYTDQTKFMQVNRVQGKITCVKILGYTNPLMSAGSIVSLYKRKGA